ncbi:C4-dicarboxylate TRAP transporter small permease protein DctQ [Azospirillaceae bacterium]
MFLRILDRLEEIIIATLMAAATMVIFIAVVHRYASGVPVLQDYILHWNFSWAQELCIYMFIWMAKFGAAYGVRTGIHVGVDVLINRLNPRMRHRFITFGLLAGAFFTGIVGTLGAKLVYKIALTEQTTPDLEWPSWILYLAIPLGSYLMCFRFLQVCWTFVRTGHLPSHDHAKVDGIPPVDGIDVLEAAKEGGPA